MKTPERGEIWVVDLDGDGNELAGIRMPEVAVPLATATGWNFRSEAAGNTSDIVSLLGSYIPFAKTRAERDAHRDPRRGIDERYRTRADYLARVRNVIDDLVRKRFVLEQDVETMVSRAAAQWEHATRAVSTVVDHVVIGTRDSGLGIRGGGRRLR